MHAAEPLLTQLIAQDGRTALHTAAGAAAVEMVQKLLDLGADPAAQDKVCVSFVVDNRSSPASVAHRTAGPNCAACCGSTRLHGSRTDPAGWRRGSHRLETKALNRVALAGLLSPGVFAFAVVMRAASLCGALHARVLKIKNKSEKSAGDSRA